MKKNGKKGRRRRRLYKYNGKSIELLDYLETSGKLASGSSKYTLQIDDRAEMR